MNGLKKNLLSGVAKKRACIEKSHSTLSVERQCNLLGISRSGLYYQPKDLSSKDLELMREIDRQYTERPFYGSRRLTFVLNQKGYKVNRKRVIRLMREMGIEAIYPKPNLSRSCREHKKYPYLLRGKKIERSDQVWSADITYIPLKEGFGYLMAIIDWHSRYVISWEVSNLLETEFCIRALERSLSRKRPEIFNTDQGVQFTSTLFTQKLASRGVQISMDGKGRALDNIFIERLWRSLKYEDIYLQGYEGMKELSEGVGKYFCFYNEERPHQSLNYQTPGSVYRQERGLPHGGSREEQERGCRPSNPTCGAKNVNRKTEEL